MTLKSTFCTVVVKIIFSKQMKLQIVNRPPLAIPLGRGRQLQFCKYTENTDANTNVNNCNCKYTDVRKYKSNEEKVHWCLCYLGAQLAGYHWLASFSFSNTKECGRKLLIAAFNNSHWNEIGCTVQFFESVRPLWLSLKQDIE